MSRKERKYFSLIDRPRQIRFLALVTVYNLVIAVFFAFCLFLPDFLSIKDEGLPFATRLPISERILYFHARIWPAVIALICLIGLHSFRVFHRLIGPLFRFRWAFDKLRQGNVGFRIKLRRKDFLHREEESFNRMLETLVPRLESVQSECRNALETVDDLLEGKEEIPPHVREGLSRTRTHLAALGEHAGFFHIEPQEPGLVEEEKTLPEEPATTTALAPQD